MMKHPVTPLSLGPGHHRAAFLRALAGPGVSVASAVRVRNVEHRNGAGHLDPAYEAGLRARVHDRTRSTGERAFVRGTWSTDASAEESGEEFVWSVTSGVDGGESAPDEETSEERGGPFVETNANEEFAYDSDESNPPDATREPFPTS
jgi:hypothetical protein